MAEVSIIICTYNRCESLKTTLESLLNVVVPENSTYEIIVVDNNSRDSTRDVATYYGQRGKLPIRYLFEPQQGKMYAVNRGINAAQGRIVVFTDDDVLFEPRWLKALLEAFEQYDCIGVGGKVVAKWDFPKPNWLADPSMEKIINGPIVSHDLGDVSRPYMLSGMRVPVGANMAFRREAFERCGLFSVDLDRKGKLLLGGGDSEFCERLLNNGEMLVYCGGAVIYHPVEPHRATKRYFRRWKWWAGRSAALMEAGNNPCKTLFGVPLWQYKALVQTAVEYLMQKISLNPGRHAAELRLIGRLGAIYEGLRQYVSK